MRGFSDKMSTIPDNISQGSKTKLLAHRRDLVATALMKGKTQYEIARELGVSQGTIASDKRFLEYDSRKKIKNQQDKELPYIHRQSIRLAESVISMAYKIMEDEKKSETTRLQAAALVNQTDQRRHDLYTQINTIHQYVEFIEKSKNDLNNLKDTKIEQQEGEIIV
jgi:uncharacterized protein YerC